MRLTTAEKWVVLTLIFGFIHHVDHVLRADNTGWPFTGNVNQFTASLLVYPVLASFFVWRDARRYRAIAMTAVFTVTQAAHTFVETPYTQYYVWAHNASRVPEVAGRPNLLDISSPLLGYLSAANAIALGVAMLGAVITLWQENAESRRETVSVAA